MVEIPMELFIWDYILEDKQMERTELHELYRRGRKKR
jgi:hypothetical protein